MKSRGIENKNTITVTRSQVRRTQSIAFSLLFQVMYFRSKAMAKYMFANKASIEARLRTMKSRLRKAVTNAKDFPLNQLVSQTKEIKYGGVSIAAFSKSASERLAIS